MVEMKRNEGFTLVELLVVIAIIAILAGIIIPNVPGFIAKARMVRAYSEIKGIDLALTKMLTDANRQDFRSGFFEWGIDPDALTMEQALEIYRDVYYVLLRNGKNAENSSDWRSELAINPDVRRRLGSSYMELAADPWGNLYNFYPGPWRNRPDVNTIPFRVYFPDLSVPGGPPTGTAPDYPTGPDGKVHTLDPDTGEALTVGYVAPRDRTIYIWSSGGNLVSNQRTPDNLTYDADPLEVGLDYIGGGDDINNWDNDTSWVGFYN
jgi:prepilin-type N-terminal cleavage/methylation domain-containing protein